MLKQSVITYLTRKELNPHKWDDCITRSFNGVIYACSWYLDNMTNQQWDALILDDYEAVMPLVWRKKYGCYYIYQPAFIQRLGIFSSAILSTEIKQLFFHSIPARFRYWDFNIDKYSSILSPAINIRKRKNYVLDLSISYNAIYSSYSQLTKRMIKKNNNTIAGEVPTEDIISFYQFHYRDIIKDLKSEDYKRFTSLCHYCKKTNAVFTYATYNTDGKMTAAMILFRDYKNTYYYLMGGRDKSIKNNPGLYKLFDHVIKTLSGQKNTLDLEGSEIPAIASFYEKFGAQKDHYYHIHYNYLPWPVRLFKNKPLH